MKKDKIGFLIFHIFFIAFVLFLKNVAAFQNEALEMKFLEFIRFLRRKFIWNG